MTNLRAALPQNFPFSSSVIVRDGHYDWWLHQGLKDTVLNFAADTPLDWYPVSREVNNVRNEHPDLIRPAPVEKELF